MELTSIYMEFTSVYMETILRFNAKVHRPTQGHLP